MQQIQYDVRPGEFADAVKSTRSARMFFWLLLGLAILLQLGAFGLIEYGDVLKEDPQAAMIAPKPVPPAEPPKPEPKPPVTPPKKAGKDNPPSEKDKPAPPKKTEDKPKPEPKPGEKPLGAADRPVAASRAEKWRSALGWALPAAKFVATVSGMLLALTILFAVGLSLVGRLGGTAGLMSAFFWSLVLFMMVVPWQQVLAKSTLACGALYNLGDLLAGRARWAGPDATWQRSALFYGRFVAYPSVALLVWLIVHVKFVRGTNRMHFPQAVPPAVMPPRAKASPAPAAPAPTPTPTPKPRDDALDLGTSPTAKKPQLKPAALTNKPAPEKPLTQGPLTERFFTNKTNGPDASAK